MALYFHPCQQHELLFHPRACVWGKTVFEHKLVRQMAAREIDEEIVILHARVVRVGAEHVDVVHFAHVDQKRYLDMR
jgi:hypothetical protein